MPSTPPYTPLPLSPGYWRNDNEDTTTGDAVSSTDQLASFVNAASSAAVVDISPEYRDLHAQISKLSSIDDAPPVSPLSAASLENSPPPPRRTFASKYDAQRASIVGRSRRERTLPQAPRNSYAKRRNIITDSSSDEENDGSSSAPGAAGSSSTRAVMLNHHDMNQWVESSGIKSSSSQPAPSLRIPSATAERIAAVTTPLITSNSSGNGIGKQKKQRKQQQQKQKKQKESVVRKVQIPVAVAAVATTESAVSGESEVRKVQVPVAAAAAAEDVGGSSSARKPFNHQEFMKSDITPEIRARLDANVKSILELRGMPLSFLMDDDIVCYLTGADWKESNKLRFKTYIMLEFAYRKHEWATHKAMLEQMIKDYNARRHDEREHVHFTKAVSVTHSLYFKTKEQSSATGEQHDQYHRLTQLITSEVRRGDENFVNNFKIIMVNRDGFNPADVLDGEHVNTFAHELSVLPTTQTTEVTAPALIDGNGDEEMQEANQDDVMSILSLASTAGHSPEIAHDSNQSSSTMAAISKIVFEEDEADDSDYEVVTDAFEPPSEAAAASSVPPPPPPVAIEESSNQENQQQQQEQQQPPKENAKKHRKRLRADSRLIIENAIAASEEAAHHSSDDDNEEAEEEESVAASVEELPPRPPSKPANKSANKGGRPRKRRRVAIACAAAASVLNENNSRTFEAGLYPSSAVATLDILDIEKILLRAANDTTVEKYHIKFTEERSGEARALPIPVHLTFQQLIEYLEKLFDAAPKNNPIVVLHYKDEDGDLCRMESETEWRAALFTFKMMSAKVPYFKAHCMIAFAEDESELQRV